MAEAVTTVVATSGAVTSEAPNPQTPPPPLPAQSPRTRRRRWPWFAGAAGAVAAVATAAVVFIVASPTPPSAPAPQADLTLQSASTTGDAHFTPDYRTNPTTPPDVVVASSLPAGVLDKGAVAGSTEGVYRATKGSSPCDRDGLVAFFKSNPSISDLWVRAATGDPLLPMTDAVKTVTVSTLPGYIAGLTPVLLRADTRATAFVLSGGVVTARQAVLQAGTAVLVDGLGLPRLRCAQGSPLASPDRNAPTTTLEGDPWPGFDLHTTVTMTAAASPVREFGLVDVTGATVFRRPAGSVGPQDIDQVPQTAIVEGTYEVKGTLTSCVGINTCDKDQTLTMAIKLGNCTSTQCTISAPRNFWIGEFPLTAADGRWSGTGPTGLAKANNCHGVRNPSTAIDFALTPGDFAVDTSGIWTANSLTGTVRRHADEFNSCVPGSVIWNVTAKRSVPQ